MKVILNKNVERVGYAGEVKEVADGFARNYLFPRKLAVKATPGALKDLELRKESIEKKHRQAADKYGALLEKISAEPLVITHKVGEEGKLHGAVTSQALAEALSERAGEEIPKTAVLLDEPIKAVGNYKVKLKLHRDVTGEVEVQVISDAPEPEATDEASEEKAQAEAAGGVEEGTLDEGEAAPSDEAPAEEAPAEEAAVEEGEL